MGLDGIGFSEKRIRSGAYEANVLSGDEVDPTIAKRLAACLHNLDAGDSWDAAIEATLVRHPTVPLVDG